MKIGPGLILAGLILAGCTTTPDRTTDQRNNFDPLLQEISQALPGRYATAGGERGQSDPIELRVESEPVIDSDQAAFILTQRQRGQNERRFLLGIEGQNGDPPISARFAPIAADGQVGRYCLMQFQLRQDGFSAQTRPEDCRFGDGAEATGLIKEIAFDGRQLVIGDRLVRIADGQPIAEDSVHSFFRIRSFDAWAGRRDGQDWHRADGFSLGSGGDYFEPLDAAGMSLGFGVELSMHRMPQGPILRLSVVDLDSGELLGESWADPQAEQLGISLPDLQVGLDQTD